MISQKIIDEINECFNKHDVVEKETRYKHGYDNVEIVYECNLCNNKITMFYELKDIKIDTDTK